ncbi:ATPase P [Limnochorda pilosa]|uniref:ATPase P n=1 Tax=Limnochorda pilosa TaxID=1555112 RepID=A0A0K2SQA5_LIMPI|nr:ATPase P [Limnochorda pilosa]
MAEVRIGLGGMSCPSCAPTIERALGEIPGVGTASVNFTVEQATVRFDPERTETQAVVHVVEEMGYTARRARAWLKLGGMSGASCAQTPPRG